jgi:hypothetical protein
MTRKDELMPEEAGTPDLELLVALKQYVIALVRNEQAWYQSIEDEEARLEAEGYRLVSGGGDSDGPWVIIDYRTRETIAEGSGGIDEYAAASERLSAEGRPLYHADHLKMEDFPEAVPPAGMPEGLCRALADWVSGATDEALEWVGGEAAIAEGES